LKWYNYARGEGMRALLVVIIIMALGVAALGADEGLTKEEEVASGIDTHEITIRKTPLNKLARGLLNSVTFLAEVPGSVAQVYKKRGPFQGCTIGICDGFATSFVRLATGLFDAVTFVLPPYDKPLLEPEYAFESAIQKLGEWSQAKP
jgi:putative exosortase-associated protein (TIGR04073 family)